MWITKALLVISISATVTRADVNELKNDGYSYERPATIPAELAYYFNIPAGHDPVSYFSNNQNQQLAVQQPLFQQQQHHHQHAVGPQIQPNQLTFNQPSSQYIPPRQEPLLPFIKENSGLRQVAPASQYHVQQQSFRPPPQQQFLQFRIPELRHQNEIHIQQNQNRIRFPQQTQAPSYPRQGLTPPPSTRYYPNGGFNPSPFPFASSQPEPTHQFMASISNSYNAPLPFPFGVVPIKFDPLPLKTNLRQEKLLPLTSYDVKKLYKK